MKWHYSGALHKELLQASSDELEQALLHELRLPITVCKVKGENEPLDPSPKTSAVRTQPERSQQCDTSADVKSGEEGEEEQLLECAVAAFLFCVVVIIYYGLFLAVEQALPSRIFQ